MKDLIFLGLFGCLMFMSGLILGMPSDIQLLTKARNSINECQKDLPRSQVCELTAKVKESK